MTNFAADYIQTVCMVAEVTLGKGHAQTTLVNGRYSAHDLGVMHLSMLGYSGVRWGIH